MTTGLTWARGMGATGGGGLSRTSGGWWIKYTTTRNWGGIRDYFYTFTSLIAHRNNTVNKIPELAQSG